MVPESFPAPPTIEAIVPVHDLYLHVVHRVGSIHLVEATRIGPFPIADRFVPILGAVRVHLVGSNFGNLDLPSSRILQLQFVSNEEIRSGSSGAE
jgi:hypothetical protein